MHWPPRRGSRRGRRDNDLIDRLAGDAAFPRLDFAAVLEPHHYVGRAPDQVEEFVAHEVEPIRKRYPNVRARPRDVDV